MSWRDNRNKGYKSRSRGRGRRSQRSRKFNGYGSRYRDFTYGNVLDKVIGDVVKLKGLINTEFKTVDTSSASAVVETGLVILLNNSIAGDDFDNRDGRVARFKSIQYAVNIIQHPTAVSTITRVMIVIDKQPNGVLMTVGQLLTSGANNLDFRNLNNRKRFVILSDRVVTQSDTANTTDRLDFYSQVDVKTIYDDSNADSIADIITNAIFMIIISSESTNGPTVQVEARLRFIDN